MLSFKKLQTIANNCPDKEIRVDFVSNKWANYKGSTIEYNSNEFSEVSISIELINGKEIKESLSYFISNTNHISKAFYIFSPITKEGQ